MIKTVLQPCGGIGVTDSAEFDEILVESSGLDYTVIERIAGENEGDIPHTI
jgi:hypothetical protein